MNSGEDMKWLRKLADELKTIGYLLKNDPFVSHESNQVTGGTLEAISRSMNIIASRVEDCEKDE